MVAWQHTTGKKVAYTFESDGEIHHKPTSDASKRREQTATPVSAAIDAETDETAETAATRPAVSASPPGSVNGSSWEAMGGAQAVASRLLAEHDDEFMAELMRAPVVRHGAASTDMDGTVAAVVVADDGTTNAADAASTALVAVDAGSRGADVGA